MIAAALAALGAYADVAAQPLAVAIFGALLVREVRAMRRELRRALEESIGKLEHTINAQSAQFQKLLEGLPDGRRR